MKTYTLEQVAAMLKSKANDLSIEAFATKIPEFKTCETYYLLAARLVKNLDTGEEEETDGDDTEAAAQPVQTETRRTARRQEEIEETPRAVAQLNSAQQSVLNAIKALNGEGPREQVVAYGTNIQSVVEQSTGAKVHYPMLKARLDELVALGVIDRYKKPSDEHTYYYQINDPEDMP